MNLLPLGLIAIVACVIVLVVLGVKTLNANTARRREDNRAALQRAGLVMCTEKNDCRVCDNNANRFCYDDDDCQGNGDCESVNHSSTGNCMTAVCSNKTDRFCATAGAVLQLCALTSKSTVPASNPSAPVRSVI